MKSEVMSPVASTGHQRSRYGAFLFPGAGREGGGQEPLGSAHAQRELTQEMFAQRLLRRRGVREGKGLGHVDLERALGDPAGEPTHDIGIRLAVEVLQL